MIEAQTSSVFASNESNTILLLPGKQGLHRSTPFTRLYAARTKPQIKKTGYTWTWDLGEIYIKMPLTMGSLARHNMYDFLTNNYEQ